MSDDFNIQNIAKLASINLSEEEQSKLSNDLSVILEHVQALSDLSLDEVGEIFIHPL
jgi:aspartyl/glutamyl-tRNA(Asn/Gln) amidotransferase C subunit